MLIMNILFSDGTGLVTKLYRGRVEFTGRHRNNLTLTLNLNSNPTPNPDPTPNPNPNPNPIGSYTAYMWNNRRNVFLWRPVNSTLPLYSFVLRLMACLVLFVLYFTEATRITGGLSKHRHNAI